MNLPASFKKVKNSFKTAAVEETKHTTAGNVGEGSGGNKKKCKGNNGNGNVENLEQDKDFAMATGEFWKEPFSKQFPQNRPSWEGKVKMCARWHIKGDCYDNCTRVTSHVTKDKIPANKKESFLTFMKKCRKAAKMSNWLLGLGPSSIRPPKNRPTFSSFLGLKQVWASPASININHTLQPLWKKSAFRHGKIHQHQLHGSQRQHWRWQEHQEQQQHTHHLCQKKSAFRHGKIHKHQLHGSQCHIGDGESSKNSISTLATPVGRNQPSAMARSTSISSRHYKSMAPNVNISNGKSSKDSSSTSKSKGRA